MANIRHFQTDKSLYVRNDVSNEILRDDAKYHSELQENFKSSRWFTAAILYTVVSTIHLAYSYFAI